MNHTVLADEIRFLRHPAGGFTEFNPNTPDLYATYYHLKLRDHPDFEGEIPNRSATTDWLQSRAEAGFVSEGSDGPAILDIYHGIECLRLLDALGDGAVEGYAGTASSAREQVQQVIDTPEIETGQKVSQVFRLLKIHDTLGVTYDSVEPIEAWLTETWRELARNVSTKTLPEMERLYESLGLIGRDHEEITAVADPTNDIAGLVFPARFDGHPREMFALRSCHELRKQFVPGRTLSDRVIRELASMQNDDGGFSASGAPMSDCKGTYIATKLLLETGNASTIDRDAVRQFGAHHALSGGGFSLNYRQPANLRATYLVCRGLDETTESAKQLVREGKPLQSEQLSTDRSSPKELYQLLTVRSLDGSELPEIDVDQYVRERAVELSDKSDPLERAHYLTRLSEQFTSTGYRVDVTEMVGDVVRQLKNADGGFGTDGLSTARQTYYGTRTLVRRMGEELPETETYVKEQRNERGGFGKYHVESPGSDVASTYYSVMTLEELNAKIENPERLVSWLEDAHHPDGGWAHDPSDRPDQGPTLEYTVFAEQLLATLGGKRSLAEPDPT